MHHDGWRMSCSVEEIVGGLLLGHPAAAQLHQIKEETLENQAEDEGR